ncbi:MULTISPECIES: restriction endonuclease subunit S [Proteus]|uniref:restriction endonuclease subunit S n=1 Tax=Proteus TaxID=583 RepID=UPI001EFC2AE6|nr:MULTISPECIES: restriction endonuclease subunit S [Proteus]MCL8603721.1 restriction endonuclease subunit S [Proteus mirabilis]
MSKLSYLEKLLDGVEVEWLPLWKVTIWDKKFNAVDRKKQPKVINYQYLLAAELFKLEQKNGDVFLLSTGEKTGWTNEVLAGSYLREGEVVTIPWGKSRPVKDVIKYYKGRFVTADNRIATSNNTAVLLNKYLYYWMMHQSQLIDSYYRGSGIQHPSMADVLDMLIPIPSVAIQSEIVRILDKFTALTAELTAELTTRKKQYNYYRDRLLSFKEGEVEWKTLGDVTKKWYSGGTPTAGNPEYYVNGKIPWLRTQEVKFTDISATDVKITEAALKNSSAKWIPKNCVIIAISGATAGRSAINKIPLTTNQHCGCLEIDSKKALYRYVFHWVSFNYESIKVLGQGARGDLNSTIIKNFKLPIPYATNPEKSLQEQAKIVAVLDKFDALTNSISEGLPREIELRQKQYEYYRDLLFNFPKPKPVTN